MDSPRQSPPDSGGDRQSVTSMQGMWRPLVENGELIDEDDGPDCDLTNCDYPLCDTPLCRFYVDPMGLS